CSRSVGIGTSLPTVVSLAVASSEAAAWPEASTSSTRFASATTARPALYAVTPSPEAITITSSEIAGGASTGVLLTSRALTIQPGGRVVSGPAACQEPTSLPARN